MKNVKKLLALLLAMTMLFALCACGDSDSKKDDKDDDKKPAASQSGNAAPSTAPSNNSDTANKAPIGSWLLEEYNAIFTLNYDGTGELNGQAITWQMLTGNSLKLVSGDQETTLTFSYQGDAVCFVDEDGEESVWVKYTGSTEEKPDVDEEPDVEPDVDVEITYDDELVATWYGEEGITMVLEEGGFGTLYLGDSDEYELVWGIVDGQLYLSREGEELYAQYEIDGDELTLTSEDDDALTFVR